MHNGMNDEILQLYRYLANRKDIDTDSNNIQDEKAVIGNYHRTDRVIMKGKGITYKRITRIKSIKV